MSCLGGSRSLETELVWRLSKNPSWHRCVERAFLLHGLRWVIHPAERSESRL
jgi:hypothetical protein